MKRLRVCMAVWAILVCVSQAPGQPSEEIPPQLRGIRVEQRLNEQLPLDLTFRNEKGERVALRDYFGSKPVVLSFAYYECPMLCTLILNGLLKAIRVVPLELGEDYRIVNISINPRETPEMASGKKDTYARAYGKPGAGTGWHFLTGDEASIRRAADAAGFHYTYDPATQQFAHAGAVMVLTPEGKFSRYFYGVEFSARDLRLGLVEASHNRIGSAVDQVLLYCFHYDPATGKYSVLIGRVIKVLASATVLILGSFIMVMFRRERKL
jgi:protein SCO1/2